MLLVSVGTGTTRKADNHLRPGDINVLFNAGSVPAALMDAALNEQDRLCRVLGRCRHGARPDREVGDLQTGGGCSSSGGFSYVRYNAELARKSLNRPGLEKVTPEHMQCLDSLDHIAELQAVGRAVAGDVQREHFAGSLAAADRAGGTAINVALPPWVARRGGAANAGRARG